MDLTDEIRSVTQSCPTLGDPMNRSTPGLPVHHQFLDIIKLYEDLFCYMFNCGFTLLRQLPHGTLSAKDK